jgi:hypothetical protein
MKGKGMPTLPNLPVGKSSFESIRTQNELYVDKTRDLHRMIGSGDYYFLSRPRRFGKSLTVSTLKCLFQGKKELFDGLWISEHGDWEWKEHPVALIDFNELDHETPEKLRQSLGNNLAAIARQYGVRLEDRFLQGQFVELILGLFRQTQTTVVVLVDEYDKPIISHLGKGPEGLEIAKKNREVMKYFFGVLKGLNVAPCLRFVFLTGVSKFSRVSIFSELNNLNDITMHRRYAAMLGYTQSELETRFAGHIREFAESRGWTPEAVIEELKNYYNGYRFSEADVKVYNPFSVLKALEEQAFKSYWFETGTPTFLVDLIRENHWHPPKIEEMIATPTVFSTYDLDDLKPEALLFQTGYVTIKSVHPGYVAFDYPNREVKIAFLETLFHSYTKNLAERSRFIRIAEHLLKEDVEAFIETVSAIFSAIPYELESKRDEAYFHTLFYLMVSASGVNARSEVMSSEGRIDLVMEFSDKVYIIEFKCNQSAKTALKQIRDKRYADMFKQTGKKIILIGIDFDSEKRNVAEWGWET